MTVALWRGRGLLDQRKRPLPDHGDVLGLFYFEAQMLRIDIRSNSAAVLADLKAKAGKMGGRLTAVAINSTAHAVRQAEREEMQRVFDRPVPYTLRSMYLKEAKANHLTAVVDIANAASYSANPNDTSRPAKYLAAEIEGGARNLKGFEVMLREMSYLPTGWVAVPGEAARLDAYGNMSRGQILQIMSALGLAERMSGYTANRPYQRGGRKGFRRTARSKRAPDFFVGRPGGGRLPLGVYQRRGFAVGLKGGIYSGIKPVMIFVRAARYRSRFPFYPLAERVINAELPGRMAMVLDAMTAPSR